MPIILENSHSHAFSFTDENGVVKNVEVQRGQDIEQLGIPLKQLTKLMSEYVVTFDGSSERPRYKHVDEMPEDTGTYNAGPTTQALVTKALRKQDPNEPQISPEERLALQRQAEAEMQAEAEAQFNETAQLQAAEVERIEREAAENAARAEAAEAKMAELQAQLDAANAKAEKTPKAEKPSGGKNK